MVKQKKNTAKNPKNKKNKNTAKNPKKNKKI